MNDIISRLSKSITFKTIANPDSYNADLTEFFLLHEHLKESFPLIYSKLEVEIVGGAGLLFYWEGRDPTLLPIGYIAHQDVVPANEENWEYDAFSGKIAEGYVWGRGTMDMKGHMMALLEAVEELISQNFRPMRDVYIMLTCNEEIGTSASIPCAQSMEKLLESRGIHFWAIIDEGGSFISGDIFGIDKNIALIGIAEKGGLNVKITARSEGGHSSTPPNISSLGRVARAIVELEENQFPANLTGVSQMLINTLAPHMKGLNKIAASNLHITRDIILNKLLANPATAAILRTTTAVTMCKGSEVANILPSEAYAIVNFRIIPGETTETVLEHVVETVHDDKIEVSILSGSNPVGISDTKTAAYRRLISTIYAQYKNTIVAPYIMVGGTDSRFLRDITDNIYRISPFKSKFGSHLGIHAANEKILVDDYLEGIEFFKSLIAALGYTD